jgi:hypothetical protein
MCKYWRVRYSWLYRHIVQGEPYVSEEHNAFIFKVED